MSSVWISPADCTQAQLLQIAEMVRKDQTLQIILSYQPPKSSGMANNLEEVQISTILCRLGVKPHLKGYQYLKTAILYALHDKEELEGITKRLYPDVAKKHMTSGDKVEHAIRHAIQTGWERGDRQEQQFLFGCSAEKSKRPTNMEFILQIVNYIERDMLAPL